MTPIENLVPFSRRESIQLYFSLNHLQEWNPCPSRETLFSQRILILLRELYPLVIDHKEEKQYQPSN